MPAARYSLFKPPWLSTYDPAHTRCATFPVEGYVSTDMNNNQGELTPEFSAQSVLKGA